MGVVRLDPSGCKGVSGLVYCRKVEYLRMGSLSEGRSLCRLLLSFMSAFLDMSRLYDTRIITLEWWTDSLAFLKPKLLVVFNSAKYLLCAETLLLTSSSQPKLLLKLASPCLPDVSLAYMLLFLEVM